MNNNSTAEKEHSLWVAFELYDFVQIPKYSERIKKDLKRFLGDNTEVFFPVVNRVVASREFCSVLYDGYVFAKLNNNKSVKEFREKASKVHNGYIIGPLTDLLDNLPKLIPDTHIDKCRDELDASIYPYTPSIGDLIVGVDGTFSQMQGEVLDVDLEKNTAKVRFSKKTMSVIAENLSFVTIRPRDDQLFDKLFS
jgi:hypothetical protein